MEGTDKSSKSEEVMFLKHNATSIPSFKQNALIVLKYIGVLVLEHNTLALILPYVPARPQGKRKTKLTFGRVHAGPA